MNNSIMSPEMIVLFIEFFDVTNLNMAGDNSGLAGVSNERKAPYT